MIPDEIQGQQTLIEVPTTKKLKIVVSATYEDGTHDEGAEQRILGVVNRYQTHIVHDKAFKLDKAAKEGEK